MAHGLVVQKALLAGIVLTSVVCVSVISITLIAFM